MNAPPRRWTSRVLFAALVTALPAIADAPSDQYAGFDRNNTTISDRKTKLVWTRSPSSPLAFAAAAASCASPTRLPTLKELLSLVDEEPHAEYEGAENVTKMIDKRAFGLNEARVPYTPVDAAYWTSSLEGAGPSRYVVDFQSGRISAVSPTNTNARARCVKYDSKIR